MWAYSYPGQFLGAINAQTEERDKKNQLSVDLHFLDKQLFIDFPLFAPRFQSIFHSRVLALTSVKNIIVPPSVKFWLSLVPTL